MIDSPLLAAGGGSLALGPPLLWLLFLALVLDAVLPDILGLYRLPHPVSLLGRLIGFLDDKLNREKRGERARLVRGALVTLFVAGLAAAIGWAVHRFAATRDYGWLVELAFVVVLLAQRSLFDHVRAVHKAMEAGGLAGGRAAVQHIVGRRADTLDEHGVARAAIESCAENYSDGVVAPAFWYLLLGLPGLCLYKAVNTLDSMIGYKTPRHAAFGMAAARLDDVMNYIPARLSAVLLSFAAVATPSAVPGNAFRTMLRDAGKHRSPNAGWPEAAMAGALELSLGGPRSYGEQKVGGAWLGNGRARATAADIRRALYLYGVALLAHGGLVAALAIVLR